MLYAKRGIIRAGLTALAVSGRIPDGHFSSNFQQEARYMDPQIVIARILRTLRLDTTVFEEAREDPAALTQSIVIAAASFFLAGLGGWFWWAVEGFSEKGKLFLESVIAGTFLGVGAWLVWIAVAYLLLTSVFHYTANLERLVRSSGLATVPMALMLVMFIPGINIGVGLAALGLVFLLMDIAIQVSVEASPGHVIMATFAGFLVFCFVLSLLVQRDTWLAPGVFLFRAPATSLADLFHLR